MNDTGAKQQIVEKIKSSSNILVTVSTDPSVDELSAALGLTLLLNKMDKHATAVFSGAVPPAITFLDPEKTFENSVDSLRDFIIALDKEKADHLRYKVDGEVVKIFITPYRTTITSDDLDFSQGDYNVELVLALGVKNQESLDTALAAHGRILHDATVASISVGSEKSELGSIDWREENASSLSELMVSLSDAVKSTKASLDEQIATAFLTGIVASTDRFSNNRTSSRVMTMAAQLMGAGANQQLIASKLEEAHEIGEEDNNNDDNTPPSTGANNDQENSDGTTDLSEGETTKLSKKKSKKEAEEPPKEPEPKKDDGSLVISHEKQGDIDEVAEQTAKEQQEDATKRAEEELAKQAVEVPEKQQAEAAKEAEDNLAAQLATVAPAATTASPSVADLQKDIAAASADVVEASEQPVIEETPAQNTAPAPLSGAVSSDVWKNTPVMGGTLNATTEQAAEDKRKAIEDDKNRTILTHPSGDYIGDSQPAFQSPINAATQQEDEQPMVDPFTAPAQVLPETSPTAMAPAMQPVSDGPTLEDIDKENRTPREHDEARAAIDAAFENPPAPEFGAPLPGAQTPETPQLPPLPPMPDFSTLPPVPDPNATTLPPEDKLGDILGSAPAPQAPVAPADPGQFKIPGQG